MNNKTAPKGSAVLTILVALAALSVGILGSYWYLKGTPSKTTDTIPSLEEPQPDPMVYKTDPVNLEKPKISSKSFNNNIYSFEYPQNWEVITKIPDKYISVQTDNVNKGKMLTEPCRGPILQNIEDPNQLIVLEIVDMNSDGAFCWSNGYFYEDTKWKLSAESEWKGDFLLMETAAENSKYLPLVSLVNYETYQLKGVDVLKEIVASFVFLQ